MPRQRRGFVVQVDVEMSRWVSFKGEQIRKREYGSIGAGGNPLLKGLQSEKGVDKCAFGPVPNSREKESERTTNTDVNSES